MAAMPTSRFDSAARELDKTEARSFFTYAQVHDTDSEDVDDTYWLCSREDSRGQLSGKSSVDSLAARKITTQRPMTPAVDPAKVTKFTPGSLDLATLPLMAPPSWANAAAQRGISSELKKLQALLSTSPLPDLGWYIDFEKVENLFQWIVELHSFDLDTPLGKDMQRANIDSIVFEVRFGAQFPFTPPFLRVIRPRFLPFTMGGGGHVTIGGAMCMELLTTTGWSPANAIESVLVQVRMALLSNDPRPARLDTSVFHKGRGQDYGIGEAIDAYRRAAATHGWEVPKDFTQTATGVGDGDAPK